MPSKASSFLVQSSHGTTGNFELVVPRIGGGLWHFWRDCESMIFGIPQPRCCCSGASIRRSSRRCLAIRLSPSPWTLQPRGTVAASRGCQALFSPFLTPLVSVLVSDWATGGKTPLPDSLRSGHFVHGIPGAVGGIRTPKGLRPTVFETAAYTVPPLRLAQNYKGGRRSPALPHFRTAYGAQSMPP
jgi:hypothetical protein